MFTFHSHFPLSLLIACCLLPVTCSLTFAQKPSRVPAYPGIIEKVQPNGDTLHIRLVGDEWKHWVTTEDGYKIELNKRGWYCYVKNDRLTCRKAHDAARRTQCEQKWLHYLISTQTGQWSE